jgi:murein DD-endopeptidase MepM/ murein hydrolase activator NlpD
MKFKTNKMIIFLLLLLTALVVPGYILSARVSLQDIRNERQSLQRSMNEARRNIADTNRQISAAQQEIERLDLEIMRVLEDMAILNEDMIIVEERYEQALLELEEARLYRSIQTSIVHARLRDLHEHGQPNILDVLVQSSNIRDFMLRMEWLTQVSRQDQQMLLRLEEAELRYVESVENEKRLSNSLAALMFQLTRTAAEYDLLMTQWEEEEERLLGELKSYEEMLEEHRNRDRDLIEMEAEEERRLAAEREAQRQRQLALLQAQLNGTFLWPVPGFFNITSGYGNRPNPFNHRQIQFHQGIDIASPGINGAPVVASRPGFVSRAATGWNGGFGTMVIVEHHGGYTTIYAHLSRLLVKEGDLVYEGTPIGLVGSTGSSTGPHLHFEIRRDGRHVNPMPYLRG